MSISNQDDYITGSDIASEIEIIKDDITWHEGQIAERKADNKVIDKFEDGLADLKEMLAPLEELEEDIFFLLNNVSLISRDEFKNYCFRLAVDCGDISEDSGVAAYVDWERFADHIEIDYTSVDYDGEEYLYHS